MNGDTNTGHISEYAGDFALDLLPAERKRQVSAHISTCKACRQAVLNECEIAHLVYDTMAAIKPPNNSQLLRPNLISSSPRHNLVAGWQTQIALAFALVFIVLAGITLEINRRSVIWPVISPTTYATGIASTETPTVTLTATKYGTEGIEGSMPTPVAVFPKTMNTPAIVPVPTTQIIR